jgi:hypothetical protein
VIVPRDCDTVWISDPENKELVTAIITINCKSQKVPPMIIFKGAYHLSKNFDNDLDGDILFARSESGFTTDRLGLKYIEHFDRFTKKSTIGLYRVIIFNGYSSHVTQDFIDYCWEYRIRLFLLLSHFTHLLQPLDVGVFQTLKHYFKSAIRQEMFTGAKKVNKSDFFRVFQGFYNKTITLDICSSAFRRTGLIPYAPNKVLDKLQEY